MVKLIAYYEISREYICLENTGSRKKLLNTIRLLVADIHCKTGALEWSDAKSLHCPTVLFLNSHGTRFPKQTI